MDRWGDLRKKFVGVNPYFDAGHHVVRWGRLPIVPLRHGGRTWPVCRMVRSGGRRVRGKRTTQRGDSQGDVAVEVGQRGFDLGIVEELRIVEQGPEDLERDLLLA